MLTSTKRSPHPLSVSRGNCAVLASAAMAYPGMSAEVFYNANIAILACQLFVMVTSLVTTLIIAQSKRVVTLPSAADKT